MLELTIVSIRVRLCPAWLKTDTKWIPAPTLAPTPSRLYLQQLERVRLGDCLRPAAHAKLAVDTVQMGLDRARRDEEPGSDFPVG